MTKRYTLKPGKHQFAPGSAAVHSNDNLTDKEAEWYLEKYPHIVSLFIQTPKKIRNRVKKHLKVIDLSDKALPLPTKFNNINENISATN
jgi:hypothetical protein